MSVRVRTRHAVCVVEKSSFVNADLYRLVSVLKFGKVTVEPHSSVNGFWNTAIREAEDMAVWRRDDYWATPLEALGRGRGDCEDFVIGKYFSLVHLGVPPEKLRLIYVRAQVDGRSVAHMVLGYYDQPDSEPLILDNLVHRIEPASRRRDLTPVFSFNAHAVFVKGSQSAGVDRITRWQDLLARMRQEGFTP